MRLFWILFALLSILSLAAGQAYTPKRGETVLKIEVEGRGNIFIKLHSKDAPVTTARILELVKAGFYNGQRFHRVEKTPKPYLVQVGDPGSKTGKLDGEGGSGKKLAYEDSSFKNVKGAVGLAHPVDDRNGGDSQFYMLLDRASFLDNNYTVFGKVADDASMDVLEKIQKGDRIVSVTVL
jgi:cyclophilin family peptidyl-prolyl cis-trans isomerase